jgi:hypothetical protein
MGQEWFLFIIAFTTSEAECLVIHLWAITFSMAIPSVSCGRKIAKMAPGGQTLTPWKMG